jgi:hypothetical protein
MAVTGQLGSSSSSLQNIVLAASASGGGGGGGGGGPPVAGFTGILGDNSTPCLLGGTLILGLRPAPAPPVTGFTGIIGDQSTPCLLGGTFILGLGASMFVGQAQITSNVSLSSKFVPVPISKDGVTFTSTFQAVHIGSVARTVTFTNTFASNKAFPVAVSRQMTLSSTFTPTLVGKGSSSDGFRLTSTFGPSLVLDPRENIIIDSLLMGGFSRTI